MQQESNYSNNGLNPEAIRGCGFEQASSSSLSRFLYQTNLTQRASCMRDTLITGMWNLQKLQKIIVQAGAAKKWRFHQIIFFTMNDSTSKLKSEYAASQIIRMKKKWKVGQFKTFFVPICMNQYDLLEIQNVCEIGDPNFVVCASINSNFGQKIYNLMREFSMNPNINQSISDSISENLIAANPFDGYSTAVTFGVEASQSLAGQKWKAIADGISNYIRNLKIGDLVSGIVFSSVPYVIGQVNYQPQQQPQVQYPQVQPQQKRQQQPQPQQQPQQQQQPQPQPVAAYRSPNQTAEPQIHFQAHRQVIVVRQENNLAKRCAYIILVATLLGIIRLIFWLA